MRNFCDKRGQNQAYLNYAELSKNHIAKQIILAISELQLKYIVPEGGQIMLNRGVTDQREGPCG